MSSKDQRRKQKARKEQERRQRQEERRKDIFFDVLDSYGDEYRDLVSVPPVRKLLGIFELDDEPFYETTTDEKIRAAGFEGTAICFDSERGPEIERPRDEEIGAGFASAVRLLGGTVRPIVFVRRSIISSNPDTKASVEAADSIRIMLLLHEIGHADDIVREINFDHANARLQIVSAEAYAHVYAMEYAKKKNYRIALQYYVQNLEETLAGNASEYVKAAVQRVYDTTDMAAMKAFAHDTWQSGGWQKRAVEERLRRG